MIGAELRRAGTIAEACTLLAEATSAGDAFLLAGGTDLVVEDHLAPASAQPKKARVLIDVSDVPELHAIDDRGATIRLGGGVSYLTLRRHPLLVAKLPILGAMAKDVGALQIQARGTLAGNLATASPAADGVAALAALDATIGLRSVRGERAVSIDRYFHGYKKSERARDEVISFVDVRVPSASARWLWRKVGTRLAQAISKVALGAVVEVDGGVVRHARFGMASVAPTTALLPNVREALEGKPVSAIDLGAVAAAVDADVAPIDDVRSTGKYRRHVAQALVRELVRSLGQPNS